MEDPTAFTIPKMKAPCSFARSKAINVSAVSPLWDMAMMTSPWLMTGFRYLNSEAYSTSTGIRHRASIMYSAIKPACQLVPQATITILLASVKTERCWSIPANVKIWFSESNLPLKQSVKLAGWSKISFNIKWSKPPFSICANSMSNCWI